MEKADTRNTKASSKYSLSKNNPKWNEDISDLSSMRLSEEEQVEKINTRQSHNLAVARAELIDRGQFGISRPFSPALARKLRASGNKTVEDALAEGSAAVALARKVYSEEMAAKQRNVTDLEIRAALNSSSELTQRDVLVKEPRWLNHYATYQTENCTVNDASGDFPEGEEKPSSDMSLVQKGVVSSFQDSSFYPLSPQGWENLNNTIHLVVKTCEALWQQLEEERHTRQRLHLQLQEQRSVITTLTAELLQIQEHQELIMRELQNTRSTAAPSYTSRLPPMQVFQFGSHRLPPEGLPMSLSERLRSRTYALSDSSIDVRERHKRQTLDDSSFSAAEKAEHLGSTSQLPGRLGLQGKSRSALQLNSEQENLNYCTGYVHNTSVADLLKSYHINDR